MTLHRPAELTKHVPPPFRPHTPDPEHESKVIQHTPAARAENALRQMLFGNGKVNKNAANERVRYYQQRDEEIGARVSASLNTTYTESTSIETRQESPSIEAWEADSMNRNGFGDSAQSDRPSPRALHSFERCEPQPHTNSAAHGNKQESFRALSAQPPADRVAESTG